MNLNSYRQRLLDAAQVLGIELSVEQTETLLQYLQQMQRWNRTYNLTALRDPELMLVQHVFDSLAVVPAIRKIAQDQAKTDLTIVDVGSGGGLPGVVLATVCSTWNIHCIDAVEKKMAFVRQMAAVLSLPNLKAHHVRIEQAASFDADVVISRAFASLIDFVMLSEKHRAPTGQIIAMKAKHPTDEIIELESKTDWRVESILELTVPELNAERCLVYLKKG